jgi:hypothetical protein
MIRNFAAFAIAILGLALFSACTPADTGPPLAPVAGTVTLDAKPLEGALVTLIPTGETKGQAGSGRTDSAGKFKIIALGSQQREGVAAGTHQVLVTKLVNPDGSLYVPAPGEGPMDGSGRELLHPTYSDPSQTRLQATVPPEGLPNLELKLLTRPGRQ